jgi:2-keto-4-pentenoate hydratase/2-oxohepta-3-ene-1,7-dioic acid hydratase in catechol pathway
MRLVTYRSKTDKGVGVMLDDSRFVSLTRQAPHLPRSMKALLQLGDDGLRQAEAAAKGKSADYSFNDVELDPVVPDPHAIWAMALNYRSHIEETGLPTSDKYPHVFIRVPGTLVGHRQPILCPDPSVAKAFDPEAELAVVIGTPGRHIPVERALEHVAGYSCVNEGSIREFQGHNRQFGLGKNFEGSGSFGPWLVTRDEYNYKGGEVIGLINGIERQRGKFDDLLFSVEEIIAYLSRGVGLRAGDVICTGTPGQLPPSPEFAGRVDNNPKIKVRGVVNLLPGDVATVKIPGIGVLENPVIADIPAKHVKSLDGSVEQAAR